MKKITYIIYFLILVSCSTPKNLKFKPSEIEKIEVFSKYLGANIKIRGNFKEDFIVDLNKSNIFYTEENISTHKIIIYNKNKKTDTFLTDGYIYQNKNYYKSKENLIKKYAIEEHHFLSDTILGKLKTFELLQIYLKKEKYDKLPTLFVEEVQWFFKEIRKNDKKRFKRWCSLWTFDKATYEKHVVTIINGEDSLFDYENNGWKINQK
ncbi:hypothetical protein [Olleya sp. HaHaR_3_96]|uniref:hypothetical protein n=1 Tax=Olleya sp. HaHaR_3_96 TaxID=2745560 RepID=UPI001C4F70D3|nr:hypothetical protein [Olleya sp. HaHaR_3_96]QXP61758.1 hypothetical protein H0I26_09065 [Olleya sp. HaHaR_3_96]